MAELRANGNAIEYIVLGEALIEAAIYVPPPPDRSWKLSTQVHLTYAGPTQPLCGIILPEAFSIHVLRQLNKFTRAYNTPTRRC